MQGIVFNGNYLTYYDVAWTEYFRAVGLEYGDFIKLGADTVLARTTLDFRSRASFDEILEVFVRVSKIGNTSMTIEFEIYPEGQERLVGTASSLYVCIDPHAMKPVPVPSELRRLIRQYEGSRLNEISEREEGNPTE